MLRFDRPISGPVMSFRISVGDFIKIRKSFSLRCPSLMFLNENGVMKYFCNNVFSSDFVKMDGNEAVCILQIP